MLLPPITNLTPLASIVFLTLLETCQQLRFVKIGIILDCEPEKSTERQLQRPELLAQHTTQSLFLSENFAVCSIPIVRRP